MRQLALSPDGQRLAFTYQGDIWVVSSEGGRAIPVTSHVEMDEAPVWSPDGKWIAFASNRSGSRDIYLAPADGGNSRRLTWFAGDDFPSDWSPDGKYILMRGTREKGTNAIYLLDVNTSMIKEVAVDPSLIVNPQFSADGKTVCYQRMGFPYVRARYKGSNAAQLWKIHLSTGKRELIRNSGYQHLWNRYSQGDDSQMRLYCVTVSEKTPSSCALNEEPRKFVDNAKRTPNVYQVDGSGKIERLTSFIGGGVRFLTAAKRASKIAFEYEGDAYIMASPKSQPKKIDVYASLDDKTTQEQRLVLSSEATDGALSPGCDKIAFVLKNDLWMVSVKNAKTSDAIQLTSYAGLDQEPIWHPDNRQLFFTSDREGSLRLYRIDTESKTVVPITRDDHDVIRPRLSPDRKYLTYWLSGSNGGLYKVPVDGLTATKIIDRPSQYRGAFNPDSEWSPDGRYIAYAFSINRVRNVYIYDTETKTEHNVTKLAAQHGMPVWSPDGKYLYLYSDRDGAGIYALPLAKEGVPWKELELKFQKPEGPVKVEIDFANIDRRLRKIISKPDVRSLSVDPVSGELIFLSGKELWKAGYGGENPRVAIQGAQIDSFSLCPAGDQMVLVRTGGTLGAWDLKKPNSPVTALAFRADYVRDMRAERQAAFMQFWREYNRSFYDPNMHGRDWEKIRQRYHRLLPSVGHRNEMATLLSMMVGELECSHAEVGPAPGNPKPSEPAMPGFTFDYSHQGPGIKIESVPADSPGSFSKIDLRPGDYVMQINGKEVCLNEALWRDVLNDQAGRDLTLAISKKPTLEGARTVRFKAMALEAWRNLLSEDLIETRRAHVVERSKGEIGYIAIERMKNPDMERFNREVWQEIQGKKGIIIDVRDNGGGNISDRLIDILERVPHLIYRARDGAPEFAPSQSWNLPTVVLHNERSVSNAEMFPSSLKHRRLATTVGMPTPGYVIWTHDFLLVDGTMARMPNSGVYRLDGSPMENCGEVPDVKVPYSIEDFLSGRDPQLDKAIEILQKQTK